MKTWKKIVLEVSLISLFLGGGLVAWGYSQGGLTDLQNQTKSEQDYALQNSLNSTLKMCTFLLYIKYFSIKLILKVVATMCL